MKFTIGSAITDEREEGEIVDDDFEDISDNSIIVPAYTGKSVSPKEHLRDISLSSVTDVEQGTSHSSQRIKRRRKSVRKATRHLRKRKHSHRRKSNCSDSDSDDYLELNKRLQQQLKAAVRVDVEDSHKNNSLKTRLKAMTKSESPTLPVEEDIKIDQNDSVEDDNKNSSDNEIDSELNQLRMEALRTAVFNKFKDRKKRKLKDVQDNAVLSDVSIKTDETETNKENTNNNSEENMNKKSCIESKAEVPVINENTPISPEEDEDVLRALLLASMSKKITTVDSKTIPNPPNNETKQFSSKPPNVKQNFALNNVNTFKINRVNNKNKVIPNRTVKIPQVKPLIINVNASDTDTDDDIIEVKELSKPPVDIKQAIECSVDKFLKEQRAKVEAQMCVTPSDNKTPLLKTKKSLVIEKSAVKLLPKNKQIEYQRLILKLKNAERKPRVRRTSHRVIDIKNNGNLLKNKLNKSKIIVKPTNLKLDKSQERKNGALLLHNTLKDMQFEKNGRLQIQEKYKVLTPFVKKINDAHKERKKWDQEVNRLLEELAEAKRHQLKYQQEFTLSVKELVLRKEKVDGSLIKTNVPMGDKARFTSTPIKGKVSLSSFEISTIPTTSISIENADVEVSNKELRKDTTVVNVVEASSQPVTDDDNFINIGDPNDIDRVINKQSDKIPKYISPLDAVRRMGVSDPFSIMCPFEVDGKCKDSECTYKHFMPDQL